MTGFFAFLQTTSRYYDQNWPQNFKATEKEREKRDFYIALKLKRFPIDPFCMLRGKGNTQAPIYSIKWVENLLAFAKKHLLWRGRKGNAKTPLFCCFTDALWLLSCGGRVVVAQVQPVRSCRFECPPDGRWHDYETAWADISFFPPRSELERWSWMRRRVPQGRSPSFPFGRWLKGLKWLWP